MNKDEYRVKLAEAISLRDAEIGAATDEEARQTAIQKFNEWDTEARLLRAASVESD